MIGLVSQNGLSREKKKKKRSLSYLGEITMKCVISTISIESCIYLFFFLISKELYLLWKKHACLWFLRKHYNQLSLSFSLSFSLSLMTPFSSKRLKVALHFINSIPRITMNWSPNYRYLERIKSLKSTRESFRKNYKAKLKHQNGNTKKIEPR